MQALRRFLTDETEDHRRAWREVGPVLQHELERAFTGRQDRIHRSVAVLGDHRLGEPLGMGGVGEPGLVEVLAVDFPVRHRPRQHRRDAGGGLDVRDEGAVLSVDDQEAGRIARRCGRRRGGPTQIRTASSAARPRAHEGSPPL